MRRMLYTDFESKAKTFANNRIDINNQLIIRNGEIQEISRLFTNKNLKKIVNVYKLEYTNAKSPGIGDYLRGCFCLMQLSKLLNIEFDLDVSQHPLSKYIEDPKSIEGINYNNIDFYIDHNVINNKINTDDSAININKQFLINIINYLNCQNCETFGLFSNTFPFFNTYSEEGKNFVRSRLRPNSFMSSYVDVTLNELGLVKKGYGVIHIRMGDSFIQNENLCNITLINKVKNVLKNIITPDKKYLIISDSNLLKRALKVFPNLYMYVRKIEHLGGEAMKSADTNGVMNTMLDFFIMEHSNAILSLSIYGHISGFSKYCSIINNIPFKYIKI